MHHPNPHYLAAIISALLLVAVITYIVNIIRHPLPPVPDSLPFIYGVSLFAYQAEYMEYCEECYSADEIPWGFKDWFETVHHYDMADLLPTGEEWNGTLCSLHAVLS